MESQTGVLRHLIIWRAPQLDVFNGICELISVISSFSVFSDSSFSTEHVIMGFDNWHSIFQDEFAWHWKSNLAHCLNGTICLHIFNTKLQTKHFDIHGVGVGEQGCIVSGIHCIYSYFQPQRVVPWFCVQIADHWFSPLDHLPALEDCKTYKKHGEHFFVISNTRTLSYPFPKSHV